MNASGGETRAEQVRDLFDRLCDLTPSEREEYLRRAEPDPGIADEVMGLLSRDADPHPVLQAELDELAERAGVSEGSPGRLIGPYRMRECLGRGGMGAVYRAVSDDNGRHVALKILRGAFGEPSRSKRFKREQRLLARLEHPHISRFLDAGITADDTPYLAMELVLGQPITVWCHTHALGLQARLRLFVQVCDAVGYAHRNLMVHRDIKPSNVFVTADSGVKLLDFGVAKLLEDDRPDAWSTSDSARVLSPDHASPEQIKGHPVTPATDVHGLGLLLYDLLTGRKPFRPEGYQTAQVIRAVLMEEPTPPSISVREFGPAPGVAALRGDFARQLEGDLDAVTMQALSKDPEGRYADARELGLEVERVLANEPVQARAASPLDRLGRLVRRRMAALAGVLGGRTNEGDG